MKKIGGFLSIFGLYLFLTTVFSVATISPSAAQKRTFSYNLEGQLFMKTRTRKPAVWVRRTRSRTVYVKRTRRRTVFVPRKLHISRPVNRSRTLFRRSGRTRTVYIKRTRRRTTYRPVREISTRYIRVRRARTVTTTQAIN